MNRVESNWAWLQGYVGSILTSHKTRPSNNTHLAVALLGNVLESAKRILNK